jgi:hypothetical protein
MARTPYEVLRIPPDCTDDAIRHAYRRLAKEYHPDSNPGNPEAEQSFIEISQAYQVIGTPQKRKLWDLMNSPAAAPVVPPARAPSESIYTPYTPPKPERTAATASAGASRSAGIYAPPPVARRGIWALLRENESSRFLLVCTGLVAIILTLSFLKLAEQSSQASSSAAVAASATGPLTDAAVALLVNGGPRLDATITEVTKDSDDGKTALAYSYRDFIGREFSGRCDPCDYPGVQGLAVGSTIKVVHLTDHDFNAPLFVFEHLDQVDPTLANRVNTLAAQPSAAASAQ